jgi:hypothetical protein
VETFKADIARIRDEAYTGNGKGGLGQIGGKDDTPFCPFRSGRGDDTPLFFQGEAAVEGKNIVPVMHTKFRQSPPGIFDFPFPGQKKKDVPCRFLPGEKFFQALGTFNTQGPPARQGPVEGFHGEYFSGTVDHGNIIAAAHGSFQKAGDLSGVYRGGHNQYFHIASHAAQIQEKGQGQIGIHRAFVEFIKNNDAHIF